MLLTGGGAAEIPDIGGNIAFNANDAPEFMFWNDGSAYYAPNKGT